MSFLQIMVKMVDFNVYNIYYSMLLNKTAFFDEVLKYYKLLKQHQAKKTSFTSLVKFCLEIN